MRPNGFPLYHWIQTERSEGLLTLEGQELLLKPGDGVLIAPHVPHEYRENDGINSLIRPFGPQANTSKQCSSF